MPPALVQHTFINQSIFNSTYKQIFDVNNQDAVSLAKNINLLEKNYKIIKSEQLKVGSCQHVEDLDEEKSLIKMGNVIFHESETSSTSKLSSPLSIVVDIYQLVVDKIFHLWEGGLSVSDVIQKDLSRDFFRKKTTSDSMQLHQLGDFFGKETGLEGYDPIQAFQFYRDLVNSLNGGEPLIRLMKLKMMFVDLSVKHFHRYIPEKITYISKVLKLTS